MDFNRLSQTAIPKHISPVSISAVSAEWSSKKHRAGRTGLMRGNGAHINRHELALNHLIQALVALQLRREISAQATQILSRSVLRSCSSSSSSVLSVCK